MNSENTVKINGIALVVLGLGLALLGHLLSGSVGSQITHVITDSDTEKVISIYVIGTFSIVAGIYFFTKG